MSPRYAIPAALLGAAFVMPAAFASVQDHTHHAAEMPAAPIPATRYTPDAPLRAGMRSVHRTIAELSHAEAGHMSAAMTRDRAATVEGAVLEMFANCKLEPTPDAALHGILVPLLSEAQALKAAPTEAARIARMRDIVAAYPRYFDDPGWDAPAADGGA